MEEEQPIVIDNGSGYCRAGFSGEEGPRSLIPSYVGYPKYDKTIIDDYKKDFYVGNDASNKIGILNFSYPIEHGVVTNWEDMEKIYDHIFKNELNVESIEHNVLLTEPLLNPKKSREKSAQIMFETFQIPGLTFAIQPLLSLYSEGKYTGFVVDSGEGLTQFAAVYDGYALSHAMTKINLSGGDITNYMLNFLKNNNQIFSIDEKEIAREIKEKTCYVTLDFEEELKSFKPFDYILPDGNHIIIKDQRIRSTEALFNPSIIGKNGNGISQTCYDMILKCNNDIKKDLYNSIILAGGYTLFNGFPERFSKEMKFLVPESMKEEVKVIFSPERKFSVWIGSSILSSISIFISEWITKKDYEEKGAMAIQ